MRVTEVGRFEMATEVVCGKEAIREKIAELAKHTSPIWKSPFESLTKVGSAKMFAERGILHVAWSLNWEQMVIVGRMPQSGEKVFASRQTWEDAVCLLAYHGQGEAKRRAEKIVRFLARKLGARVADGEKILAISVKHRCVITAQEVKHMAVQEIDAWVAGVKIKRRPFVVETDVGSRSLLWVVGSCFALHKGWSDLSLDTARAAAVIEKLRIWDGKQ